MLSHILTVDTHLTDSISHFHFKSPSVVFMQTVAESRGWIYALFNLPRSSALPVPVVVRSKAWICSRSLAGIVGLIPTGDMDVCLLWVLCVVR